jgi:tetratricopeptide (TPR) repeat protein
MTNLLVFAAVFGMCGFGVVIFFVFRIMVSPKKLHHIESLIANGNVKSAIRQAKTLLSRNERNADAHFWLGECYRAENRPDLAVIEYKYITGTGSYTAFATQRRVRKRLAEEYLKLGQIDECQKEYILLSKLEPANFENYYEVARLFEQRNFADSALANYRKAIAINPEHVDSHVRLGRIYLKKQLMNEAKTIFTAALRLDPENAACHYYLGKIARVGGDPQSALVFFEKALHKKRYKQRALLERANIFIVRGDREKAVSELKRALSLGEEDIPAVLASRYLLALCYELEKDLLSAIEQWEKIHERNPKYRDVEKKLSIYSSLRADDRLKDFLTASDENFKNTAASIIRSMGLTVQDVFLKSRDIVEAAALETQSKWRSAKKAIIIVRIYRSAEPIGYDEIRGLYDTVKKQGATRSICVTASQFSKSAIEFAQIRPIDLIDREDFTKLLHAVGTE